MARNLCLRAILLDVFLRANEPNNKSKFALHDSLGIIMLCIGVIV